MMLLAKAVHKTWSACTQKELMSVSLIFEEAETNSSPVWKPTENIEKLSKTKKH